MHYYEIIPELYHRRHTIYHVNSCTEAILMCGLMTLICCVLHVFL